jgi:hypothetical protein
LYTIFIDESLYTGIYESVCLASIVVHGYYCLEHNLEDVMGCGVVWVHLQEDFVGSGVIGVFLQYVRGSFSKGS